MSDLDQDLGAFKKMKVQELRDACEEKGLDSTGVKAVLLDRLEASMAGGAEAPPATDGMEEELEDIPDDNDEANAGDGDLVDPDAAAAAPAATPAAVDVDAAADAAAAAPAAPAVPAKSEEELTAERAVVVAAVEADIEKRKARAERFGVPFVLTDADNKRLECAKAGKPMPGSKEETEQRRKLSEQNSKDNKKNNGNDAGGKRGGKGRQAGGGGAVASKGGGRGGDGSGNGGRGGGGGGKGGDKRSAEQATEFESKKKARAERFGTGETLKAVDPEFEAKMAARAARFAENKL